MGISFCSTGATSTTHGSGAFGAGLVQAPAKRLGATPRGPISEWDGVSFAVSSDPGISIVGMILFSAAAARRSRKVCAPMISSMRAAIHTPCAMRRAPASCMAGSRPALSIHATSMLTPMPEHGAERQNISVFPTRGRLVAPREGRFGSAKRRRAANEYGMGVKGNFRGLSAGSFGTTHCRCPIIRFRVMLPT
jgi:hypothetical protein